MTWHKAKTHKQQQQPFTGSRSALTQTQTQTTPLFPHTHSDMQLLGFHLLAHAPFRLTSSWSTLHTATVQLSEPQRSRCYGRVVACRLARRARPVPRTSLHTSSLLVSSLVCFHSLTLSRTNPHFGLGPSLSLLKLRTLKIIDGPYGSPNDQNRSYPLLTTLPR